MTTGPGADGEQLGSRPGGGPEGSDAVETERMVGEILDQGSRALAGELEVPAAPASPAPHDPLPDDPAGVVSILRSARPAPDPLAVAVDQVSADLSAVSDDAAIAAVVAEDTDAWTAASAQQAVDTVVAGVTGEPPPPGTSPPPWVAGPTHGDTLRTIGAMTVDAPEVLAEPQPGSGFGARHQRNLALAGVGIVALAAFLGALLLLGGSGGTPSASPGPSGAAVIAGPTGGPTAAPTAVPSAMPTVAPTVIPTVAPTPDTTPTPAVQSVTLRGPIDVTTMTTAGLTIGQHDAELTVFLDDGSVRGSFVLAVEQFPIGALLTQTFSGEDDPDFAAFKTCTVRMVLEAPITGTYDEATGKLKGKATFTPQHEDVNDCLKTRPANLSVEGAVDPTTVTWSATFDGTTAKGTIGLDPKTPFTATLEE